VVAAGSNCIIVNCTLVMNNAAGGNAGSSISGVFYSGNGGNAFGGGLANFGNCSAVNLTFQANVSTGGSAKTNNIFSPAIFNGTYGKQLRRLHREHWRRFPNREQHYRQWLQQQLLRRHH